MLAETEEELSDVFLKYLYATSYIQLQSHRGYDNTVIEWKEKYDFLFICINICHITFSDPSLFEMFSWSEYLSFNIP